MGTSSPLLASHRRGFPNGHTDILRAQDDPVMGLDFGIRRMVAGQTIEEAVDKESLWLLMSGRTELAFSGQTHRVERRSLFDELPSALLVPAGQSVSIRATSDAEWAVVRVHNARSFAPRLFLPKDVQTEHRGRGLAQGTCQRTVRLIFDLEICPKSNLVVGEVVNYPGLWSSYPPHHHDQPEIYHYRFTEAQGYGHAELGDDVFKVQSHDTIRIPGGLDHAQVSAPGYGMYYIWIVRHLADNPYRGFEYTDEHRWLLDPKKQGWRPSS